MSKAIAGAMLALLLVVGLIACGGGGTDGGDGDGATGGEMNITVTSFPDYLDPQLSYAVDTWEALWVTYLPLLTFAHAEGDAGAEVTPALAEDLPEISQDRRTYTLRMRQGMKYSDGTPIRASDFKFAVERMFTVNSGGTPYFEKIVGAADFLSGKAKTVSGITANDQTGEITIELETPSGTFTNELALMFSAPIPSKTPKADDPAGLTNNPPPASGPYMITNVEAPRSYTLQRNPSFQTVLDAGAEVPEANVDTINITQNKSQANQASAVQRNEVDYMYDPPPPDLLPEIESRLSDRFEFNDSNIIHFFWLNNVEPPFDDVKVRQAVNHALDPDALVRFFGGRLSPLQQILPPAMPGHEQLELYPGPDLERARELIEEANPEDREITVWVDDEPDRKRIGAYYQDVLEQLGFNANLKTVSAEVYFSTIGNLKTPDLDTGWASWLPDYAHPNAIFQPMLSSESLAPTNNGNLAQADIPELSRQIAELSEQPLSEAADDYAELDRAYMERAVWAPFGNERFTTFVSDRVDFDAVIFHPVFGNDYTSFQLTG